MTPIEPRLSVAIPVAGMAESAGLKRTLDGLFQMPNWDELEVLVQVGSSDSGTFDPALTHHPCQPIWSFESDRGVYDAMNRMAKRATGTRILFLGAGDVPLPGLSLAMLRWDSDPNQLEMGGVQLPDSEARVPDHYPPRWDRSLFWRNTAHHQGMAYPLSLLQAFGGFPEEFRVLGDYALSLDLFKSGVRAQWHADEDWIQVQTGGLSRQFNAALYQEEWALKKTRLPFGFVFIAQPIWIFGKALWKISAQRRA